MKMQRIVEKYQITADGLTVDVHIKEGTSVMKLYELNVPKPSSGTLALLNDVRNKLVTEVSIPSAEMFDPRIIEKLKTRFKERAEKIIIEKLGNIDSNTKNFLVATLLHEMAGLGDIEFLLSDGNLEEIIILSANEPVRVYHKKYGWLQTNIVVDSERKIQNYANMIARRVGRQITNLNPLLDAHLITGDRANAVFYPISNKGNTITIRKFARDPWTITDFIINNTTSAEIFATLWLAIQYEMNILVSGGTGSGKTTFLNLCMPFIPPNQRIISIEDTRELQLPSFLYWCPLTTREPNPEGKGEVSMLDLLVNSLRMRPDRIILGEIRRHKEAEVLFEAMHTGHSVYATVHADSAHETIARLINPPISVPPNLLSAINLNVVMFRDRRKGVRRTYQIAEFVPSEQGKSVSCNILYRWRPSDDKFITHAKPIRFFEELSRHTGLGNIELLKDLENKKRILNYMAKNNIRRLEDVGMVMNQYYIDPEFVIECANKNKNPSILLSKK